MSVEVVNLQGGKAAKAGAALAATALGFNELQALAITPQTVSPTGGVAPYSFAAVGFPAGIVIGAASGIISGTATASGFTTASVTVTDSKGVPNVISVPIFFSVGIGIMVDTLRRITNLGAAWAVGDADSTQPSYFQPTMSETLTGLLMSNLTAGGASLSLQITPTILGLVLPTSVFAPMKQFAEVIFVGSTGGFPGAGPSVAMVGDPLTGSPNGYYANIQPPNNFLQIRVSNVGQRLITGAGSIGSSVAAGAIIRIAIEYGVSNNQIHVYVNGVEQPGSPFTDSDATRPLASDGGLPGMFWKGAATATNIRLSDFRGGVGLG